jgi:aminotransferase
MTRLALRHGAVNLAQGFPDFAAPDAIKQAAIDAIAADVNQYAITWGTPALRQAIAAKYQRFYGIDLDPDREITVVCGSTEGMIASLLATANPGDEVIVFEPFYENYSPDAHLSGASARFVSLHPPHWTFDPGELRRAFNSRTRAIILNSPHNPTGKVFSRDELEIIASLCQEFGAYCITDEIYEHIIYGDAVHIPMATLPGMRDRAITINSMSKTYSVTGWRVGWVIAPPEVTGAVRKVHDFLTVGAAAPLSRPASSHSLSRTPITPPWPSTTSSAATCSSPSSTGLVLPARRPPAPTTSWRTSQVPGSPAMWLCAGILLKTWVLLPYRAAVSCAPPQPAHPTSASVSAKNMRLLS